MPSSSIVISEIYASGGNTGGVYDHDYVVVHNNSSSVVDLSAYSLQYASGTGGAWASTSLAGTVQPGGYFLVQEGTGGLAGGAPLPAPDETGTVNMNAVNGKVALVQGSTPLTGAAPDPTTIVDLVGYGPSASASEASPAPSPSATQSIRRVDSGTQDTDNNGADFVAGTPSPQNSQSPLVCFVTGTLIRTVGGDVAVEDLAVGDLAVTASGEHRPIKWIGSRTVDCRDCDDQLATWPVRIKAHAFGDNLPYADLLVSPGHAICLRLVDEVFVRAGDLINEATIAQVPVDEVTYWHVELESHDVLLANGLPAESYIDVGNRAFFAGDGRLLDGTLDAATIADYGRPLIMDAASIGVVRARLHARATGLGWSIEVHPDPDLRLEIDGTVVRPTILGDQARFIVPSDARNVWLLSRSYVPFRFGQSPDPRELGVQIRSMAIDDGLRTPRALDPKDPLLCVGFHAPEGEGDEAYRWTTGRARLPSELWAGCTDQFFLKLRFVASSMSAWTAPIEERAPALPQPEAHGDLRPRLYAVA